MYESKRLLVRFCRGFLRRAGRRQSGLRSDHAAARRASLTVIFPITYDKVEHDSIVVQSRAICITTDPGLRRILRRSLSAAGSTVEFVNEAAEILALPNPRADILLVDEPAR